MFLSSLHSSMWVQHDGAPSHDTNDICQQLSFAFRKHWICRGGPVQWPSRSSDLSCLYFCWSQMKTLVYDTAFDSVEDVVACISVTEGEMRGIPGIFQSVRIPCGNTVEPACLLLVEISNTFCRM
ncbi:hypothetical protein AVEN_70592-1 [Araneus ventricosus]|uniref:Uncharacterized protein n=1 Tax=Araneus ventricosus TaxID=182803 RepID=A0A4Y2CFI7_ARAVE|nr:hypothetical protein AVEN_70592-1 [Araneus ventricosus]